MSIQLTISVLRDQFSVGWCSHFIRGSGRWLLLCVNMLRSAEVVVLLLDRLSTILLRRSKSWGGVLHVFCTYRLQIYVNILSVWTPLHHFSCAFFQAQTIASLSTISTICLCCSFLLRMTIGRRSPNISYTLVLCCTAHVNCGGHAILMPN
jgi:hypothetical protein